ncbi:hypothetical protein KI387_013210, partial [Taxus chinensis]
MSPEGPKSNGTSGTNGGEVREGPEGAEDQSETATCPHRRKSQKVKGASYRALNRTNEMAPRVLARAHKENSKDSSPKGRGERITRPIRACHVSSRWRSVGKYFEIYLGLFRALNLQIAISFDLELGFP